MSEHVKDTLYTIGGWILMIGFFSLPFLGLLTPEAEANSSAEQVSTPDSSYSIPANEDYADEIDTSVPDEDYSPSEEDDYSDEDYDSGCNSNYSGCVEDSSYDLDCADVGEEVEVIGYDEYGLDGDGDGWGCESY